MDDNFVKERMQADNESLRLAQSKLSDLENLLEGVGSESDCERLRGRFVAHLHTDIGETQKEINDLLEAMEGWLYMSEASERSESKPS